MAINSNSQSAIHLTKNNVYHEKTNHIDVLVLFVRDKIENGLIKVKKVYINDNPTDVVTKEITSTKFDKYLNLIGVTRIDPI